MWKSDFSLSPLRICGVGIVVALLLVSTPIRSLAQRGTDRPSDRPLDLPDFSPPKSEKGRVLPPVQIPEASDPHGLAGGRRIFIRQYHVSGNTVISDQELLELTRDYVNRAVTFAELEALRDNLTRRYIEAGYITSGAVIPDQTISEGIFEFKIVEGTLAKVNVSTDGRFRKRYFEDRLQRGGGAALNVKDLEERLQILQQDPRIRSVHAALVPAKRLGEAVLNVDVYEERPFWIRAEYDNYQSPTIGSELPTGTIGLTNLTGFGDALKVSYGRNCGLSDFDMNYELPINARDTTLGFHISSSRSEVIEDPFSAFDIESRSATYGVDVRHPLYRSLESQFQVFLTGELRRSKSYVMGSGFSFSPGPEEGISKVSVLRFGQAWTYRNRTQVVAARSTLSLGLDVFDATVNQGNVPDGQFLAWLGQLQWAHRFDAFGLIPAQVIVRADVQLTDSPLLGMEQFAIGGHNSVRGYHENTLVRDNGTVGAIEFRVPIFQRHGLMVELAPFFDIGHSWQTKRETVGPKTISSAGIGIRLGLKNRARMEVYWGQAFRDFPNPTDDDNLQDSGIHFRVEVNY